MLNINRKPFVKDTGENLPPFGGLLHIHRVDWGDNLNFIPTYAVGTAPTNSYGIKLHDISYLCRVPLCLL